MEYCSRVTSVKKANLLSRAPGLLGGGETDLSKIPPVLVHSP